MQGMNKGNLANSAKPQRAPGHHTDSCLFFCLENKYVGFDVSGKENSYRKVNAPNVEACSPPQKWSQQP